MIYRPNFVDWDFDNVWHIIEGETYPYLRNAEVPAEVQDITANGRTVNAVTGDPIANIQINIRQGSDNKTGDIIDTLMTDSTGKFKFDNLSIGSYTAEVVGSGYVTNYLNFNCIGDENNLGDISLMPIISGNKMTVVLTWGENPDDLDSYFTGEGQMVYFDNKDGTGVTLDVDDVNSYGPETITIDFDELPAGTYRYFVKWFSGSGTWATSKAKVQVYLNNSLVREFNAPSNLSSGDGTVWNVFSLDSETQTITAN